MLAITCGIGDNALDHTIIAAKGVKANLTVRLLLMYALFMQHAMLNACLPVCYSALTCHRQS